jgi:hypothetical protein
MRADSSSQRLKRSSSARPVSERSHDEANRYQARHRSFEPAIAKQLCPDGSTKEEPPLRVAQPKVG